MLNSTLTASERTLCCILENYQTPDGVRVPPCLQPFMMGGLGRGCSLPPAARPPAATACARPAAGALAPWRPACQPLCQARSQPRSWRAAHPPPAGMEFIPFRKAYDAKGKLVELKAEPAASGATSMSTN
jgi:hypothetical protein